MSFDGDGFLSEDEDELEVPYPFSEDSELTDIILLVEKKKIHVNKHMLMLSSPVFRQMFCAEFMEKKLTEIPLPDKTLCDVVAFLRCIHPEILDTIDESNVDKVLPLADEYQCSVLKTRCEKVLLKTLPTERCTYAGETTRVVQLFLDADKFGLKELSEACMTRLYNTHSFLLKGPKFDEIPEKQKLVIFRRRLALIERNYIKLNRPSDQQAFLRISINSIQDK